MTKTTEIVTFRTKAGIDPQSVAAAAAAMEPFLKKQGGMIRRDLSVDDDGLWTDHILWTSHEAAMAASQAVMQAPEAGPFMALIDESSVSMRHATSQLQME